MSFLPPSPTPDGFECLVRVKVHEPPAWRQVYYWARPGAKREPHWRWSHEDLPVLYTHDELAFAPLPTALRHEWVSIAECGELQDGEYDVLLRTNGRSHRATSARRNGQWHAESDHGRIRYHVTHVLSPSLGPIPEAP